jgi:hypothetical protein
MPKMKKINFAVLIVAIPLIMLYACKKEEENPQTFVQEHIIGRWPIKYQIKTLFIDDVEQQAIKGDTLITYNPIDTLIFTAEGQAITRNKTIISTVGYTVSPDGETLTFLSSPAKTVKITFVRNTSIGLGDETRTQVSGKTHKTVIADHLIK